MRTVTLIKDHGRKPKGSVIEVENNKAHSLIEQGVAKLGKHFTATAKKKYQTKEMSAGKGRRYLNKRRA